MAKFLTCLVMGFGAASVLIVWCIGLWTILRAVRKDRT